MASNCRSPFAARVRASPGLINSTRSNSTSRWMTPDSTNLPRRNKRINRLAQAPPLLLDLRHTAAGFREPREDQRIVPRHNQPRVGGELPHPLLRLEV